VKLVMAIVHGDDADVLVEALLRKEFRATKLASSGGFLRRSNATVMLGVEDDQVEAALEIVKDNCTSRTEVVNPMHPIMEPGVRSRCRSAARRSSCCRSTASSGSEAGPRPQPPAARPSAMSWA
jgi:uncharacterized protein YaaQ